MGEKMEMQLADESLDDIVGGAFNQQAVKKYGLDVKTLKDGSQGLSVQLTQQTSSGSTYGSAVSRMTLPENALRKFVDKHSEASIAVQTTSGEWKTLSRSEFNGLFS
jgi:hypothetical protein